MRDTIFDIMKGIGIIAMIIGHCSVPAFLWKFIFSWHMPLFFIISGYFFKQQSFTVSLKKNAGSLIIPYIYTCVVIIGLSLVRDLLTGNNSYIHYILASIIGSGSDGNPCFSDYNIGAVWFLMALFWCRVSYNYISVNICKYLGGVIILASIISTILGNYIFIPTNILQGCSALLFFHVGYYAKSHELLKHKYDIKLIICAIVLIILSTYLGAMSMVRCFYSCYPINVFAAIGGAYLLYYISKCINHLKIFSKILAYVGRISILILCVHIIDLHFTPISIISSYTGYLSLICVILWRVVFAVAIAMILSKFSVIKNIYRIK